ncbi:hypothetical protein EKD04_022470 [Chloroflexales bacterium ZM16-3]|nr:hypothetical protein [Chloroflexales bacterium ZM16-3]
MKERARRLNQAVRNCELLFVLTPSGSGKDRFFDWWWQEGCAHPEIADNQPVNANDIILVSLTPPPSRSVPPTCVAFIKIWRGLQELDRATTAQERTRPTGKPRSWFTEQQSLSLVYDFALPLDDDLQPQAYVLLNGEYLDKAVWRYLLELQSPIQRGAPRLARRSLIICASVDPAAAEDSKFAKMISEVPELRAAWPRRMVIDLMDAAEFQEVLLRLVRQNLNAVFAEDVDQDEIIQEAANWTQGIWRLLTEQLIRIIDEELGPAKSDAPRVLTKAVWERVRKRWEKRQW